MLGQHILTRPKQAGLITGPGAGSSSEGIPVPPISEAPMSIAQDLLQALFEPQHAQYRASVAARIERYLSPSTATGCREWQRGRDFAGYGRICIYIDGAEAMLLSHRIALSIHLGRPLTAEECALHRCDNPPCGEPEHLFAGTYTDNAQDRNSKGRQNIAALSQAKRARSPLVEQDVFDIKYGRYSNLSLRKCAQIFPVHLSAIREIRQGRNWANIGPDWTPDA